jgi:hypothetical protein
MAATTAHISAPAAVCAHKGFKEPLRFADNDYKYKLYRHVLGGT